MRRIRVMERFRIAIGVLLAIAIPLLCVRLLYVAYTDRTILALFRGVGWVTYESHPGWFVYSVITYSFGLALSLVLTVLTVVLWRREHALEQRRRAAPQLENSIRLDVNSR
jgi:hypothetical protein